MDLQQILGLLFALLAGAAIVFFALQSSTKARIDGAVAQNGSELRASLASTQAEAMQLKATLQERASALEAERNVTAGLRSDVDAIRKERELANNEISTLNERASQLPRLSGEVGQLRAELAARDEALSNAQARVSGLEANLASRESALGDAVDDARAQREAKEALSVEVTTLLSRIATLEQQLSSERENASEKLQLLDDAKAKLSDQFKLIANDILQANSASFVEQSGTNLGGILDPFRARIADFQKKVEEIYVDDAKDRAALKEQVGLLLSLNNQLSEDAKNLTSALRGSNKSQGNWGELILQRILEDAGMSEGREFLLQDSQTSDEGKRQQPDVVIQLPEGRKIVVDAKISLVAFERGMTVEDEDEQRAALREHINSVRAHIRGLAERKYDQLYGASPDFVIMFVPLEPAFMMAVSTDERLCADAWDKNVLLVSPSTLLFVLRTVAYLWRQEAQSRNAKEIADRGSALYDKLAGFVNDLEAVGNKLNAAQQSYDSAYKKLSTGRGSVVRQAEMLSELGIKTTKRLPKALLDDEDQEAEVLALPPQLHEQLPEEFTQ